MLNSLSRQESKLVSELVRWDARRKRPSPLSWGHLFLALGSVVFRADKTAAWTTFDNYYVT